MTTEEQIKILCTEIASLQEFKSRVEGKEKPSWEYYNYLLDWLDIKKDMP